MRLPPWPWKPPFFRTTGGSSVHLVGFTRQESLGVFQSRCSGIYHILFLVGGLEHVYFPIQLGIIIPIDELIFFRGVAQPPTSCDASNCRKMRKMSSLEIPIDGRVRAHSSGPPIFGYPSGGTDVTNNGEAVSSTDFWWVNVADNRQLKRSKRTSKTSTRHILVFSKINISRCVSVANHLLIKKPFIISYHITSYHITSYLVVNYPRIV